MGIRQLEAEILAEARKVTGRPKLRQKDILAWSTGPVNPEDGEETIFLPGLKVSIAVKKAGG
jgi:hypothetical protein